MVTLDERTGKGDIGLIKASYNRTHVNYIPKGCVRYIGASLFGMSRREDF